MFSELNKVANVSFQLLTEAFGKNCHVCVCLFRWHTRFKEGPDDVEDNKKLECPVIL